MFLAPGLSSELADPGRSQARNNIRELSMEKPAVRVQRRGMGTEAYIPFERPSKQSCSEGPRRRGLEGSAQPLSHPKCHPALYRNSFPQGESEPSLTCPQTRDASRRAGKASSQPAVRAPACSNPLPTATWPPPAPHSSSTSQERGCPSSPGSFLYGAGFKGAGLAGPSAGKSCPNPVGAAELLFPEQVREHPQGWTK